VDGATEVSPRARRFAELRRLVREEDHPKLTQLDDALRGIQEKHHPGSRDVAEDDDRDLLEGEYPEDQLDEIDW
jgi:hypothetical protein